MLFRSGMVVVGELGEGEEIDPVVLIVRNEGAEIHLQRLVRTLSQTVGLGMVGRRVLDGDLEMAGELGPEARNESRAAVGDDGVRETVVTEDAVKEEPGETGGVERFGSGDEVGVAGKPIAHDPDGVVAMRCGELDDVVHRDVGPGSERDVEGLEESKRLVSWGLDPAALVARLNV